MSESCVVCGTYRGEDRNRCTRCGSYVFIEAKGFILISILHLLMGVVELNMAVWQYMGEGLMNTNSALLDIDYFIYLAAILAAIVILGGGYFRHIKHAHRMWQVLYGFVYPLGIFIIGIWLSMTINSIWSWVLILIAGIQYLLVIYNAIFINRKIEKSINHYKANTADINDMKIGYVYKYILRLKNYKPTHSTAIKWT